MPAGLGALLFAAAVVVSLAASWLLVSRLERLGERAGFSEAWLGLVAALAADAPEITSAVTALARGQASVGVGVAVVCLLTVAGVLPPSAGLALTAAVLVPYGAVLGMRRARMERLRLPTGWAR